MTGVEFVEFVKFVGIGTHIYAVVSHGLIVRGELDTRGFRLR
jgi:hypothetical protein